MSLLVFHKGLGFSSVNALVNFYKVVRNLGSSWNPISNAGNPTDATQVKKELKQRLELGKFFKQSFSFLYCQNAKELVESQARRCSAQFSS
jgi:hypothetical protein